MEAAPRLRPRWVVKDELAVSPMPRPEDLEMLAEMFPTVYSLATPSEYVLAAGIDPRGLRGLVKNFVWTPVGEYNAPTLPELARAVEEAARPRPVLVHCLRGCGRSPLAAAAWLIRHRSAILAEALTAVREAAGCGLETMPQRSVVEAYWTMLRAGLGEELLRRDVDDPVPEYVALLARSLSWLRGVAAEEEARRQLLEGGPLRGAAELLARVLGYSLAGVESVSRTVLRLHVWIPRRAHPAAVPRAARVPGDLGERLLGVLRGYAGLEKAEIKVYEPGSPPWL